MECESACLYVCVCVSLLIDVGPRTRGPLTPSAADAAPAAGDQL